MSDEFQVGDVVVCIRDKPLKSMTPLSAPYWAALKIGNIYRVSSLVVDAKGERGVTLAGVSSGRWPGWSVRLFRKLPRADAQFTAQMRACKPHRVGEPA